MFNAYVADKRLQMARRTEEVQRKEVEARKRYHTDIQPVLLERYHKRLTNFIQKMTTNPIIINPQNLLPPIKESPHFTFRDAEDWKSVGTYYRQKESKGKGKVGDGKQYDYRLQTLSSEAYSVYKHEFRSRHREKQLQPAMRFKSVEKIKESKKKKHSTTQETKQKQTLDLKSRGETFIGLRDTTISISNNSSSKTLDEDEIEFLLNRQKTDIELEARLYEKQREPDEKKMHFKKIADLALTQKDEAQKKDLREILRRSGYSKMKRINLNDLPETDNFSVLVEKIAGK